MPDGFRPFSLFGKADMGKATAKVPTTGKEDLSGWEKRVVNAAPLIQSLSRDAPSTAPGPQALLLFIAAVLIDILGVLDRSMPALDCIYGPARTRVEINSRDASSHRRDYDVTPRGQR